MLATETLRFFSSVLAANPVPVVREQPHSQKISSLWGWLVASVNGSKAGEEQMCLFIIIMVARSLYGSPLRQSGIPSTRRGMMSFSFNVVGGSVNGSSISFLMIFSTLRIDTTIPLGLSTCVRKRTHLAQPSCPTRHFDIHCLMAHALFVAHRGRTDVVQRLFCQGANVAFSRLHNEQHTGQLPKHVYEQKARVEMRKQNLLSSQRPLSYMSAPFCRCHSRRRHLSPLS